MSGRSYGEAPQARGHEQSNRQHCVDEGRPAECEVRDTESRFGVARVEEKAALQVRCELLADRAAAEKRHAERQLAAKTPFNALPSQKVTVLYVNFGATQHNMCTCIQHEKATEKGFKKFETHLLQYFLKHDVVAAVFAEISPETVEKIVMCVNAKLRKRTYAFVLAKRGGRGPRDVAIIYQTRSKTGTIDASLVGEKHERFVVVDLKHNGVPFLRLSGVHLHTKQPRSQD